MKSHFGVADRAPPAPPIAGSVSWRVAATAVRFGLSFVTVPLLTRALGMPQWGLLALFQAAVAPLLVLDVGTSAATVKHASEALGRGDRDEAARTAHTVVRFDLVVGAVAALIVAALAPWMVGSLFAIPAHQEALAIAGFRLVAVNWFVAFAGGAYMAVVAAHQRHDIIARNGVSIAALSAAAAIATALLGGDVVAVLGAQTAAQAVGAATWYRAAIALLPAVRGFPRWDGALFARTVRFGTWSVVATLGTIVSGWTDRYVLGANFAPATVGFYAIAQMLQMQIYGAFADAAEVLFPAVSHRVGRGDAADARALSLLAGWALTIAFGTVATVLAVVGGDFIGLWVSPEAADRATTVLRLLCVGGAIGIGATAPLHYLLGAGHGRTYAIASLLTGGSIATTSILLVPKVGIAGAGVGLVVGVLVRTVFVALVWRSIAARTVPWSDLVLHLWVAPALAVASITVFAAVHDRTAHVRSWAMLIVEVVLVTLCTAGLQLGTAEVLPGGRRRRRDLVASFRPVLLRLLPRRLAP